MRYWDCRSSGTNKSEWFLHVCTRVHWIEHHGRWQLPRSLTCWLLTPEVQTSYCTAQHISAILSNSYNTRKHTCHQYLGTWHQNLFLGLTTDNFWMSWPASLALRCWERVRNVLQQNQAPEIGRIWPRKLSKTTLYDIKYLAESHRPAWFLYALKCFWELSYSNLPWPIHISIIGT